MGPVAGIQLTPDEQRDIQQEISNLNMRLLSVEKSTEILAVNTNRTNAIVKDLKRNYYDVSRSPLLSPVPRARLATPDLRPPTPRPTTPSLSGVESGTCGVCRRIPPL